MPTPTKKPTQVEALAAQVGLLARTIADEKDAQQKANEEQERANAARSTLVKALVATVVVLTVIVGLLAIGLNEVHDANEKILAQRTEARINTCLKDKKFVDAHNNLVNFFLSVPQDPTKPADPELRKRFEDENIVPVPDCSPEGIEAFYAGKKK